MIANVLAIKDDAEINNIKKASEITNKIFSKYLKDQIVNAIDGEKVKFIINYILLKLWMRIFTQS